jgi:molybdopterin synthase sulfur carrier subunit
MRVNLSSHFRSYTSSKPTVAARGATVGQVLDDLDRQFPGLRFRIIDEQDHVRTHVKVFVNLDSIEDLATPVTETDEIHVMGALSGG